MRFFPLGLAALAGCQDIDVHLAHVSEELTLGRDTGGDTGEGQVDSAIPADTSDTGDTADSGLAAPAHVWGPGPGAALLPAETEVLRSVFVVDFDGDGLLDVVTFGLVNDALDYDVHLRVLRGNGAGVEAATDTVIGRGYATFPSLADITGDGWLDVVSVAPDGARVVPCVAGVPGEPLTTLPFGGAAMAVVPADLDGDGVLDLLTVGNGKVGADAIAEETKFADGTLAAGPTGSLGSPLFPYSLVPVRLSATLPPVVVVGTGKPVSGGDPAVQEAGLHPSVLVATALSHDRYSDDGAWFGYGQDLDGDGLEELVTNGTDGLQVWNPATSTPAFVRLNDFSTAPVGLVRADLDGDGADDALEYLAYTVSTDHSYSQTVRFSASLVVGGAHQPPTSADFDIAPMSALSGVSPLAAGDLDGDACAELVFVDAHANVWLAPGECGG